MGRSREKFTWASDDIVVVYETLNQIPSDQRRAFLLIEVEGLKPEEAASVLQVSVRSVMARVHHARKNLRKLLAQTYLPCGEAVEFLAEAKRRGTPATD